MVEFRVIDRRRKIERIIDLIDERADDVKREVAARLVTKIAGFSPVDTGTYMETLNVRAGRARGVADVSSRGKPRRQPREPFEARAIARMTGQISSLSESVEEFFISSTAVHAAIVEYGSSKVPAYAPFTKARDLTRQIARQVVEEKKFRD